MSGTLITNAENAFYSWASGAAAGSALSTVIFAMQSDVRPALPYATLHMTVHPRRLVPQDERRPTSTPGALEVSGEREFTMSVNVYGPGARELASDLADSLELQFNHDLFAAQGIAIVEVTGTNDLTTYLETRFEERAQFDVIAKCVSTQTDSPGYFNTLTLGTNTITE